MFELKPDFEQVLERYEAWWDARVLDRALVSLTYPRPPEQRVPWPPEKRHPSLRERWMDTQYVVERAVAGLTNTVYFADALPVTYPNLGPEVFSAFYGCPLEFTETTSWSVPILDDCSAPSVARLRLDTGNEYYLKLLEITDALLDVGRDRFIVGYTDLHPGADALAAFRDPQELCLDVVEHPREVRALVDRVTSDFLRVYDTYHARLAAAGMPSTSWLPATCRGRYHIPSNDFSCMVSDAVFEDLFLPGLVRECRHMDRCIYHLDGPQALRFLDRLLAIPQIHAIQWVPGAGNDHWLNWVEVYQRIQAAGKAFVLYPPLQDLDKVFQLLRPEGAWLHLGGVADRDTAEAALEAVARWRW
ncbi:MAG: hypothetical protein ABIL09_18625 [Gemmatimonadota bacterium]